MLGLIRRDRGMARQTDQRDDLDMNDFETCVSAVCKRIEGRIGQGPAQDEADVIAALNEVIAAELTCISRYRGEFEVASRLHGNEAAAGFAEHIAEEQAHADRVASHVRKLGGVPAQTIPAAAATKSASAPPDGLEELTLEDIRAERMIIAAYEALARWLRPIDETAAQLLDEISVEERDHLYR
ncbi:MAG: ferritin-like domain-containing protein [Deltaproteobacteria bacterium]|nr:ferritin-like domain-containing protein [Deltaproteobacteria bacterium]